MNAKICTCFFAIHETWSLGLSHKLLFLWVFRVFSRAALSSFIEASPPPSPRPPLHPSPFDARLSLCGPSDTAPSPRMGVSSRKANSRHEFFRDGRCLTLPSLVESKHARRRSFTHLTDGSLGLMYQVNGIGAAKCAG